MGFSSFALTEPSDKRWGVGGRNDDLNLKVKKYIYIPIICFNQQNLDDF